MILALSGVLVLLFTEREAHLHFGAFALCSFLGLECSAELIPSLLKRNLLKEAFTGHHV